MKKITLNKDWIDKIDADEGKNEPIRGSYFIGALFAGTLYFNHCFWIVRVPVACGRQRLEAFEILSNMPTEVKWLLARNKDEMSQYQTLFVDCIDYGYGISELTNNTGIDQYSQKLAKSADQQLRSCVTLLLEATPNPKSVESAQMAAEMFLKCFISLKIGLTEKQAKKIGHDLDVALSECLIIEPSSELNLVRSKLNCFPSINDRYEGIERPKREMWNAYRVTQFIASSFVRHFTDRDTQNSLFTR